MPSSNDHPRLSRPLANLHRDLGISPQYAKARRLPQRLEPVTTELVEVGISDEGRPILLVRAAAEAWAAMRGAAIRKDLELVAVSGFRSIERQAEIIREKLAAGQCLAEILRYVAAPGFSEHHTGRALDIATADHIELDEEFEQTTAFRWLIANADQFGFTLSYPRDNPHGIAYEPWHWYWSVT